MANVKSEEELLNRQQQQLDNWYNTSKANLETSKNQQLQDTYVNQQLLNKYLPQSIAQQGLSGSGVENLYKIDAAQQYQSSRNDIYNNINNSQIQLEDTYNTNQNSLDERFVDMYERKYDTNYENYLEDLSKYINSNDEIDGRSLIDLKTNLDSIKDDIGSENYNDAIKLLNEYSNKNDYTTTMQNAVEYISNKIGWMYGEILSQMYEQIKETGNQKDLSDFISKVKIGYQQAKATNNPKELTNYLNIK